MSSIEVAPAIEKPVSVEDLGFSPTVNSLEIATQALKKLREHGLPTHVPGVPPSRIKAPEVRVLDTAAEPDRILDAIELDEAILEVDDHEEGTLGELNTDDETTDDLDMAELHPVDVPLRSKSHTKTRKLPSGSNKQLRFSFRIHELRLFSKTFRQDKFAEIDPLNKVLIAIGSSASYSANKESQVELALKLLNKGMKKSDFVEIEDAQKLITQAIDTGLINDSEDLMVLTAQAEDVLVPKKSKKEPETDVKPEATTKEEPYFDTSLYPNPYIDPEQEIPKEIQEFIETHMPGYRALQVLAELELSGGVISGKSPWVEIKKRCIPDNAEPGTYKKSLESLEKKEAIEIIEDEDSREVVVTLTHMGWLFIEHLKANPKLIENKDPSGLRARIGSSFRIVEWVAEKTGYDINGWVKSPNSSGNIVDDIRNDLDDLSEEAAMRRVYCLREEKGYLEGASEDGEVDSRKTTSNLRVTQRGLDFLEQTIEAVNKKDDLLDDDAIWELEMMTETCKELANQIGKPGIAEELSRTRDEKHLAEMMPGEFEDEELRITMLLEKLRLEYSNKFSKQKSLSK